MLMHNKPGFLNPIFLYYSIKCVVDEGDIHYVRDVGILLQLLHIQVCMGFLSS